MPTKKRGRQRKQSTCTLCDKRAVARNLCNTHYQQKRRAQNAKPKKPKKLKTPKKPKKPKNEFDRWLENKHLNQSSLARILNVSRQAVSCWKNGICQPNTKQQLQLIEILGISKIQLGLFFTKNRRNILIASIPEHKPSPNPEKRVFQEVMADPREHLPITLVARP